MTPTPLLAYPSRKSRTLAAATLLLVGSGAAWSADTAPEPVTVRAVAHFGFDGTAMLAADRDQLLAEVGRMGGVTWQRVTAVGHTDSVGAIPYNDRLAARRAQAVRAYLVAQGLDAAMIEVRSAGEGSPARDNDSADGRAANRRTEVEFHGVRPRR